jgi:hypothetical protein
MPDFAPFSGKFNRCAGVCEALAGKIPLPGPITAPFSFQQQGFLAKRPAFLEP